jgi:hypothetical protein
VVLVAAVRYRLKLRLRVSRRHALDVVETALACAALSLHGVGRVCCALELQQADVDEAALRQALLHLQRLHVTLRCKLVRVEGDPEGAGLLAVEDEAMTVPVAVQPSSDSPIENEIRRVWRSLEKVRASTECGCSGC